MTSSFRLASRRRRHGRLWMAVIAVAIAACTGVPPAQRKNDMTATSLTLWQAIDSLVARMPFSVEGVEAVLPGRLSEDEQRSNDAFQFYKGNLIQLDSGVVIRNVDLRVRRAPPHPAFLVLNLQGTCITLEVLRSHHPTLHITGVPRGHSAEESTTHSLEAPWGRLSFGFKVSNPKCVDFVAFDPVEFE